MGAVVSMPIYRRALANGDDAGVARTTATLTPGACHRIATTIEHRQIAEQIRYDHQARQLRALGVDPANILGPRP